MLVLSAAKRVDRENRGVISKLSYMSCMSRLLAYTEVAGEQFDG